MLMPGRAWLDLAVSGAGDQSVLQLTALFQPRGLAGLLHWQALRPIHRWLFARQLRKLVAEARELDAARHEHPSERTPRE